MMRGKRLYPYVVDVYNGFLTGVHRLNVGISQEQLKPLNQSDSYVYLWARDYADVRVPKLGLG